MAVRTSREIAVNVFGIVDEDVLEYRWGPGWLVWDAERMTRQCAQHVDYPLQPDRTATSTVVRVDVTVDPDTLIPDFTHQTGGHDADRCGNRGPAKQGFAHKQPQSGASGDDLSWQKRDSD